MQQHACHWKNFCEILLILLIEILMIMLIILGTSIQNLVKRATRRPEFVHPCPGYNTQQNGVQFRYSPTECRPKSYNDKYSKWFKNFATFRYFGIKLRRQDDGKRAVCSRSVHSVMLLTSVWETSGLHFGWAIGCP